MEKISIENINTGDCMLESASSWLANQIQNNQECQDKIGGKYNHAGMFWWCYDVLMVIESDIKGPRVTPFEKCYMKDPAYKSIMCLRPKFPVDGVEYGKYMLPFCGKANYNFFGLIYELVKFKLHLWIGDKKPNTKHFMCGELVAHFYNNFNPGMFINEPRIAPVDLYDSENFEHYIIK